MHKLLERMSFRRRLTLASTGAVARAFHEAGIARHLREQVVPLNQLNL